MLISTPNDYRAVRAGGDIFFLCRRISLVGAACASTIRQEPADRGNGKDGAGQLAAATFVSITPSADRITIKELVRLLGASHWATRLVASSPDAVTLLDGFKQKPVLVEEGRMSAPVRCKEGDVMMRSTKMMLT